VTSTPSSSKRALRARAALTAFVAVVCLLQAIPAHADRIDELSRTLEHSPEEKARLAAAVALGRLADGRGVPALNRALNDKSPVVRGVAATALGHIGDARAIPALERALGDANEAVRTRARDALSSLRGKPSPAPSGPSRVTPKERPRLDEGKVRVTVKPMTTKTASKELAKQMHAFVIAELQRSPEVSVATDGAVGRFVIDGAITKLSRSNSGPWVEVSCEVRITISTADGRILSMVTGGATVQTPANYYRPKMDRGLHRDALENAVRGAHQNLITFLGRQLAAK
jgi:hypothetical protein